MRTPVQIRLGELTGATLGDSVKILSYAVIIAQSDIRDTGYLISCFQKV